MEMSGKQIAGIWIGLILALLVVGALVLVAGCAPTPTVQPEYGDVEMLENDETISAPPPIDLDNDDVALIWLKARSQGQTDLEFVEEECFSGTESKWREVCRVYDPQAGVYCWWYGWRGGERTSGMSCLPCFQTALGCWTGEDLGLE